MSWESTIPYYRTINETVKATLGGLHSARLILYSVDFHEVEQLQHAGNWEAAGAMLADAARSVLSAGAQALVLCTNTMHTVAPAIESQSNSRCCISPIQRTLRYGVPGCCASVSWARASPWERLSTRTACATVME